MLNRRALITSATACAWRNVHAVAHAELHFDEPHPVPVLVYQRVADSLTDGMTVRTVNFASHLRTIQDLGCKVISLSHLMAYRLGHIQTLPPRAVVISIDDGHRSIFEYMAPALKPYGWPITVFIDPSAISNAYYAMSWEQIRKLQNTGQFIFETHAVWLPHVDSLTGAKRQLQEHTGKPVSFLSWHLGKSDLGLMQMAAQAGYFGAFSLGARPCTRTDPVFSMPRYLMPDAIDSKRLARLINAAHTQLR